MAPEPAKPAQRASIDSAILELDGIRGLAVALVVAYHYAVPYLSSAVGQSSGLGKVLGFGWSGVDLFFVLSGFLITGILIDTREAKNYYTGFIARRALRILPLYYVTLFAFFVVVPVVRTALGVRLMPSLPVHEQVWFWVYLHNWVQPFGVDPPVLRHLWSLAVEEQFYILWPFVIRAVSRDLKRVIVLCATVAVASLACRVVLLGAGMSAKVVYDWTVCRLDGLALGGLMAASWRYRPRWLRWMGWAGVGAAAVMVVALIASPSQAKYSSLFMQRAGYSLLAVIYTGVVALAVLRRGTGTTFARWLRWRPLRSVGKVSYGMYVLHMPIYAALAVALHRRERLFEWLTTAAGAFVFMAVGLVSAYALALLSWNVLEKRANALKTGFAPRMPAVAESGKSPPVAGVE